MKNATITVSPMSAHTGAEIGGVDLSQPMSEQTYLEIRQAFNEWGAIFFRGQDITPEQQLAFARRFGTIEEDDYASNLPTADGFAEIKEIVREAGDARNVGGFWHMDKCFLPHPDVASILYARELPANGGDTISARPTTRYHRACKRPWKRSPPCSSSHIPTASAAPRRPASRPSTTPRCARNSPA